MAGVGARADTGETVLRIELNDDQRCLVAGDVHGCFATLEQGLEEARYDPDNDVLLGVGDLVDRGPDSLRALPVLEQGQLLAIRGNHDDVLRQALCSGLDNGAHELIGGWWTSPWWKDIARDQWARWHRALDELALAAEIRSAGQLVAVVHGWVSEHDWDATRTGIEAGDEATIVRALWGSAWQGQAEIGIGAVPDRPVSGAGHLIVGHHAVPDAHRRHNVWSIDTGLGLPDGRLTLAHVCSGQVRTTTHEMHAKDREHVDPAQPESVPQALPRSGPHWMKRLLARVFTVSPRKGEP